MAKGLFCLECGHWEAFDPAGSVTRCKCATGQVVGWWIDFGAGLAQMAVLPGGAREKARVVLIHTPFMSADVKTFPSGFRAPDGSWQEYGADQIDVFWRQRHADATQTPPRPEALQIFSPGRRNCPLVITRPGTTPDTFWATDVELRQRGLLDMMATVAI